jgi:hypothetical protein
MGGMSREFIIFVGLVVVLPCLYLLGRRWRTDDEEDEPDADGPPE